MSKEEIRPVETETSIQLKLAIVGGGHAGESFLSIINESRLGKYDICVSGMADIITDSPGMLLAEKLGVECITDDYRDLFEIEGLDAIIELTGEEVVRDELERLRPRNVRLVDSFGASLFWELYTAEQTILKQQQEVSNEREWITQIFNGIPDEIMVIDPDGVVKNANSSLLSNNDLKIEDVLGKFCYELELKRGACGIGMEGCPFDTVAKSHTTSHAVRQYFDEEGNRRYVAIVAAPLLDSEDRLTGVIESTRDITHRIRLEEELQAADTQLRQFMEMAPVSVAVKNLRGQYIQVNQAATQLLGRSKVEILGRTDRELCEPETAEVFTKSDSEVVKTGKRMIVNQRVDIHGEMVSLHTTKFALRDAEGRVTAVCGLSLDVTEQEDTERELESTRDYLSNILNNSPVIIITADLDGNIVSFNSGAVEALGYASENVIGNAATIFYTDPEERARLLRRVSQDGSVRGYETELLCENGELLPVSLTLSELKDSEGRPIGTVGIAKDVSHRKVLTAQMMQSERLAAVGRLASGVAHEINNPLAVISEITGYLHDLVVDDPECSEKETQSEFRLSLPKILKEVKRCRSITKRLLSFARKSDVMTEVTDVNNAMEEILPFWEKQARMANVVIHREYSRDLPKVRAEEMQLQEIFINLINNAIQAISAHGRGNVWIRTLLSDGKVVIEFEDDGPGIDESIMDKLFDPFVSTKPLGQGTGLGLSICYGIIKNYDGMISVDSTPGEGAVFRVILPAA